MTNSPVVVPGDLGAYQAGDPQFLINQATADVRRYCHWHVTPSLTEIVTLDGSGSLFQSLPSLNVTAVTSVTEDGVLLDPSAYTWSQAGYEWSQVGQLWRSRPWSGHFRSIVVEMTHGYDQAPDLAGVILARASRMQGNPNAATRTQVGQVSEQLEVSSGFTAEEINVLDLYRLPPRP